MKGRVLKSTGSWYEVRTEGGETLQCRMKGKLRLQDSDATNPIAVGDRVVMEKEEDGKTGVIKEVLERENYVVRESPRKKFGRHIIAANLDQAMLIVTLKQPKIKLGFIDRFLAACEAYHVPVIIVFNKMDILKDADFVKLNKLQMMYEAIGYPVMIISSKSKYNISEVRGALKNNISLIAGHSGVGKSTFINAVEPKLDLKTAELSGYTGKGVHTTTFATMYELTFGGFVVDTPGIKELSVLDIDPEELSHYFREMNPLINDCQFNNCLHTNEPGCAVKEAVENGKIYLSRFESYLNILTELQQRNRWEYR